MGDYGRHRHIQRKIDSQAHDLGLAVADKEQESDGNWQLGA